MIVGGEMLVVVVGRMLARGGGVGGWVPVPSTDCVFSRRYQDGCSC